MVGVFRAWGRVRTEPKKTNTPKKGQKERKNQMLALTPQACPQLSATRRNEGTGARTAAMQQQTR